MKRIAMFAAVGLISMLPAIASARPVFFGGFHYGWPVAAVRWYAPAPIVVAAPAVVLAPVPVVVPAPSPVVAYCAPAPVYRYEYAYPAPRFFFHYTYAPGHWGYRAAGY